jgi:uncharacterized membrane protein/uncharacterized membrane protein (UPF0136 family)
MQKKLGDIGCRLCHVGFDGANVLALLCAAVMAALLACLAQFGAYGADYSTLDFLSSLNWGVPVVVFAVVLFLGVAAVYFTKSALPIPVFLSATAVLLTAVMALAQTSDIYYTLGLSVLLFLTLRWCLSEKQLGQKLTRLRMRSPTSFALTCLAVLFFTLIFSYYSILRYRTYNATNFDLGLFAQMFESLRKTGTMQTTLERNELLTHFAVHCSPVYYLLYPFYFLFPRLETLLVLQAAAVGAGALALRKIAWHLGFSPLGAFFSVLLYLFHPAFGAGCLFDFHENKFLALPLLWAFYFMLRKKPLPAVFFCLLVLTVKEDAAIYTATLALFFFFYPDADTKKARRTRKILCIAVFVMSAVGFFISTAVVRYFGDGPMFDRLGNFFYPGAQASSVLTVAESLVGNFVFAIREIFTEEKIAFLLWVFVPLAFLPFIQKHNTAWVLFLPLLAVNLLSNYPYQHAMGYQYTYGSAALVLVAALFGCKTLPPGCLKRRTAVLALGLSLLCAVPLSLPKMRFYADVYRINQQRIERVDAALAALPKDAEITATTWFCVHLYTHTNVYMYPNYYEASAVTEYLLCKPEEVNDSEALESFLTAHYTLAEQVAFLNIYMRNDLVAANAAP